MVKRLPGVVAPLPDATALRADAAHLRFIDGLRGLAMLVVLLYHCWLFGGKWQIAVPFGSPGNNVASLVYGHVGVNLFLVLSGFCLYWPFTRPGRPEPSLWTFARKRCRRLLPPYYVALAFFWAFLLLDVLTHHHYHEDATGLRHVVLSLAWHLVMLHNLRGEYVLSINGVFWSLALEFSLYVLFPLLVEAFRRFGPWLPAAAVLAVDLAWRHAVADITGSHLNVEAQFVLCNSLPGRCFEFAAGMVAAWTLARLRQRAAAEKAAVFGSERRFGIFCTGACVLSGGLALWQMERFGSTSTYPDVLWGVCFAFLVVAASRQASLLNRVLSAPLPVSLGVISYSVYLIHLPLSKALDAVAIRWHLSNDAEVLFQLFLVVPLMLLLGYVFHRLFERPFMSAPPPSRSEPYPVVK